MTRVHAEQSMIIAAAADTIYAVLADYRNEHPNILPKPPFLGLQIEQGGQGAGTIFRTQLRMLGVDQAYHMVVTEPVPGQTLIETDLDTGLATTFTVTPTGQPGQTAVKIASDWEAPRGIKGLMDRISTPFFMRQLYAKELRQLAAYVQQKQAQA